MCEDQYELVPVWVRPGLRNQSITVTETAFCSYYINKTLCSLVNCWFFQVRNIQYNDFRNSLKVVRPSLSPHSLKFFEEWNSLYGSSAWEWSYRTEKMVNVDWYSKISSLSYLLPLTKEFWLSSRERRAKRTNLKRCLSWSFMLNALEFNCISSFLRLRVVNLLLARHSIVHEGSKGWGAPPQFPFGSLNPTCILFGWWGSGMGAQG